jgi:hypothetical protein
MTYYTAKKIYDYDQNGRDFGEEVKDAVKVRCSITGTTIDCKGKQGYYFYLQENGDEYFLCPQAYRLFAQMAKDFPSGMERVPEAARKRSAWLFVGDPDSCVLGGGFEEAVWQCQDEMSRKKGRKKKQ